LVLDKHKMISKIKKLIEDLKIENFIFNKYDANIIWLVNDRCNLSCKYCENINNLPNTPERIIDIDNLMKCIDKHKKRLLITLVGGGEPFLIRNIIPASEIISKNHYLLIFSNLTSDKIKEFSEKIKPERVENIIASLHIKELEKKGLTMKYIENYNLLKNKGFPITSTVVAHPTLIKDVERYKKYFLKNNIEIIFIPYLGYYKGKLYPEAYTEKDIEIFNFKKDIRKTFSNLGEVCTAGYQYIYVLPEGKIQKCSGFKNQIGNIYESIKFDDKLVKCPFKICTCPLKKFNTRMYDKAIYKKSINPFIKYKIVSRYISFNDYLLFILGTIGIKINTFNPRLYNRIKNLKNNIGLG
jgi:MoaA/NifB/PqqE/SkfB family radical SAM enzyme